MTAYPRIRAVLHVACVVLCAAPALAGRDEYRIGREEVARLSPSLQRRIAGLQYLLNPYQLRQFFGLADDSSRSDWIERYWRAEDPTPTTPENEKMDEHTIRVNIARQLFDSEAWPGWDRRGEVFVRYGAPNVRAKIPAEVTVRKVHPPGELWYYARHAMVVVFRDESLSGHYIYAVNPLGATQDMTPELAEFLLYEADRPLQNVLPPEYLEFYRDPEIDPDAQREWGVVEEAFFGVQPQNVVRPRMRGVSERLDEPVDPDTPSLTPNNPSVQFIMKEADEMANRFEETLDTTPASYPFNFERQELLFFFGVAQFKGGEGINRIEVNVEFPVEPRGADEVGATRSYVTTAVVLDADYGEVARVRREVVVPAPDSSAEETRLLPAQLVFSLERDYYRLAVTGAETRLRRGGTESESALFLRESSYRSTIAFREFGGELAISDALFAQKIAPAEKQSPFNRGALEVVPHPVRRYRRGSPVPIYFELYNLGVGEDGLTSYEIEYRIVPHEAAKKRFWDRFDGEPTVVSSRFRSSGYHADEPVHVTIQSDNLESGTYDFLATIKDVHWQSVVYRRATFKIVD
jgi:GWxTD domain-containing protein